MDQLSKYFLVEHLQEAREKVNARVAELQPNYDAAALSKLIFRMPLSKTDERSKLAHLQAINVHLNRIFDEGDRSIRKDGLYLELSKSITLFDRYTGFLNVSSGTYGDNYLVGQHFYLDAIGACKNHVPSFYQGDIDFACIPIKLRLAVEIYFKNMIGYISAQEEALSGPRKGKVQEHRLSIATLLKFFSDKRYKKFARLPVDLEVLKDINYWSNHLVHTGVISFAWQNLSAIDLLSPLFSSVHENGSLSVEGFNYIDLDYDSEDLARDLSDFLSNKKWKVTVDLRERKERPVEGVFYYQRQAGPIA